MRSLLSRVALIATLVMVLVHAQQGGGQQQQQEQKKGPPPTPLSTSKHIKTVNGELFREAVIDPTVPVVIAFTSTKKSCKKCKAFMESYEATAAAMSHGYAHFTVIDGGEEEGRGLMQMFNMNMPVPAMVMFNPELLPVKGQEEGSFMKQPVGFGGSYKNPTDMANWLLQAIASHQITRLEDEQDTDDLLARYAMNDVPKIILFTEKDQVTSPTFKAISHIYRYAALFGLVNVSHGADSLEVAERYRVKTYPTVISVLGNEVDKLEHSERSPVNLEALGEFVSRVALNEERRRQIQQQMMNDDAMQRKKEAEDAKKVKALTPLVITSEKEWTKECVKRRRGHCIAVFVEDVTSASDMELLTETSVKLAKRSSVQTQIVIMDGQANHDLAETFEANNGYPSVVFVNPMKKGFHNMIGSYNAKAISSFFMDKAVKGKGKPFDPKKLPAFQVTPVAPTEDEESAITDDE